MFVSRVAAETPIYEIFGEQMDRYERDLFAFLIGNMKQMEVELRAQSMVFEAVARKVMPVEQMGSMLETARNSTEMLRFVEEKYSLLSQSRAQRTASSTERILDEGHRLIIN